MITYKGQKISPIVRDANKMQEVLNSTIKEVKNEELKGITKIRSYAFYSCRNLTNIELPENLISVGANAFRYCSAMENDIELRMVENVGEYAFANSGITSLVLGANAKSYGRSAFFQCSNLKSITLENGATLGNYIFEHCTALESIELPPSASDIKLCAFNGCTNLKKVVLPETLSWIDRYAFQNCDLSEGIIFKGNGQRLQINSNSFSGSKLQELDLPNGFQRLYSLGPCKELKRVYCPPSSSQFDGGAFSGCTALENLTINKASPPYMVSTLGIPTTTIIYVPYNAVDTYKTATNWAKYADQIQPILDVVIADGVTEIAASQFAGAGITSVYMPDSVLSIGESAFDGCTSLAEVRLSENLESIGSYAFRNCKSIESVEIPDSVTSISDAFYGCKGLESVDTGNGLTVLSANAFRSCVALKSVKLGDRVSSILSSAFSTCVALGSVEMTDSVVSIGDYAFDSCISLTNTDFLGNGVKTLGNSVFNACTAITSANLPDSLETTGTYLFNGCTNLKTATFGRGIKKINQMAFHNCTVLESITILAESPPLVDVYAFGYSLPENTIIYVPAQSLEAYKAATNWAQFADRMEAI